MPAGLGSRSFRPLLYAVPQLARSSAQLERLCDCAGEKLLLHKQHADLLESYEQRKAAAEAYMKAVRPDLQVSGGPLLDPKVLTCMQSYV